MRGTRTADAGGALGGFVVEGRHVGAGHRCLLVAEVAQAHDGSLGTAHAYIDAVAKAGADAIKFQTHFAADESSPDEPFRVAFSRQDATRFEYWKRMEFAPDQWRGLADHAREVGLAFLSSPFSARAVALLRELEVGAWKVASGEINNLPLIEEMASDARPMIFSTGLATWAEVDEAVSLARSAGAPVAVLQCATQYPCPPEQVGLNVLEEIGRRYACPFGLSDHSATIYPALAAATLGASLVEVHVTLTRESFGPDVLASLTMAELAEVAAGIRFIDTAMRHPAGKDTLSPEQEELRRVFGRSLVTRRALSRGEALAEADLAAKKPGWGIPAARLREFVGRKLKRDIATNTRLSESDVD